MSTLPVLTACNVTTCSYQDFFRLFLAEAIGDQGAYLPVDRNVGVMRVNPFMQGV